MANYYFEVLGGEIAKFQLSLYPKKYFMNDLLESMLPKDICQHFEAVSINKKGYGYEMILEEYSKFVPSESRLIAAISRRSIAKPEKTCYVKGGGVTG